MSPPVLDGVSLSWIDGLALLVIVGYGIAGLVKGAIRFIVGLATVVVGIILAGTFGESLGASDWPLISGTQDSQRIGVLVGCATVFAGTLLAGALLSKLLRAAAEETDMGGVDRTLGLVFGLLRGAVYVTLFVTLLMFARSMFPDMTSLQDSLDGSSSLELTRAVGDTCRGWFPPSIADWLTETLELEGARPEVPR